MIGTLFSRLMILFFGTLYPGYASYKAIRAKDVNECTKWLKYWIVYAGLICIETIADVFLFWFPLYYEIKVILVLCLISPSIEGSSTLYSKLVQPTLELHESDIDEYLSHVHEKGYSTLLELASKVANCATDAIMHSGIKLLHVASSWAAQPRRVPKSNLCNQLPQHHEEPSRSSSLSDIETYFNERMIITELSGDDVEEDPQPYQNSKLAEAMERAKKRLQSSELSMPRSYSTSSIDTSCSQRSIITVIDRQLSTDVDHQDAYLLEKPEKKSKQVRKLQSRVLDRMIPATHFERKQKT
ncbi:hypothetical protein KR044_011172 [Drosophila immigrans]|nr:hypothetical protein KR044_011172 [Drosophila immigrans]